MYGLDNVLRSEAGRFLPEIGKNCLIWTQDAPVSSEDIEEVAKAGVLCEDCATPVESYKEIRWADAKNVHVITKRVCDLCYMSKYRDVEDDLDWGEINGSGIKFRKVTGNDNYRTDAGVRVGLSYFRGSGEYYGGGDYNTYKETLYDMWEEIRTMRDQGRLPGVTKGVGKSLIVSVVSPPCLPVEALILPAT